MDIRARYDQVLGRVARAAERSGRPPEAITLIGVSKTQPASAVREAFEATGLADFGENKAQELVEKHPLLADLPLRWHFIGHLQTNKARRVAGLATLIHSVDSVHLAERIAESASAAAVPVLLQVNTSGEATKFGVAPDEAIGLARAILSLPRLRLRGLMTLGPLGEDPIEVRSAFRRLRDISERVRDEAPDATILSMGMSGDFEVAIEEGATHVRVGTALFGPRRVQEGQA